MTQLKLSKLISEKQVQEKVQELGAALTKKFQKEPVVAVCVLKGSFIFFSDLIRALDIDVEVEFLGVSSYHGGTKSSGEVKLTLDLSHPLENKHVLLVEDIVDTGLTMNYLKKTLQARNPKSLTTVAFLFKPDALKTPCELDHVGFKIKDEFVVGYGLDYQGFYRNLPYVAEVQNLQ